MSPPYNFSVALMTSRVSTSYGMLESGKQSSAMMTCVGLTGEMHGDCRSTLPTLLNIFGSLANHPVYEDDQSKIRISKKNNLKSLITIRWWCKKVVHRHPIISYYGTIGLITLFRKIFLQISTKWYMIGWLCNSN